MRKSLLFGLITFLIGWIVQAVSLRTFGFSAASPHWLLLCILALAGMGKLNLAQTLGFFWGLSLDVFGMSLFGLQGWLLAAVGFVTGKFSRQLNTEKLVTQEVLALTGTAIFWAGFFVLDGFFRARRPRERHPPGRCSLSFS